MGVIQFNTHDLFLAMTVLLCLLFSLVLALVNRNQPHPSKLLLNGILIAHALIAWHELSYYGNQFRYSVMDVSPNLFFIGNFAYFVDAVLLYLFVKAALYKDFKFTKVQLLHILPMLLFGIYMISVYYSLDDLPKRMMIWNWWLTNSWHYISVDFVAKLIRIGYGLLCLKIIALYILEQRQLHSDSSVIRIFWLRALVLSFVGLMSLELVLATFKVTQLFTGEDIVPLINLGLFTYYVNLVLLITFLTYAMMRLSSITPISSVIPEEETTPPPSSNILASIECFMEREKPYLDPEITLNELANQLEMSAKALSVTLNHHFQLNFYEFINRHRINEAKVLLVTQPDKSITEVYCDVGFNSKSVFNTFFKKYEDMTPSAYRKLHS